MGGLTRKSRGHQGGEVGFWGLDPLLVSFLGNHAERKYSRENQKERDVPRRMPVHID
jgi:hypothetical protein